jgi:hypothetical protein
MTAAGVCRTGRVRAVNTALKDACGSFIGWGQNLDRKVSNHLFSGENLDKPQARLGSRELQDCAKTGSPDQRIVHRDDLRLFMHLKTTGAPNHELQIEEGSQFNRSGVDLNQKRERKSKRSCRGLYPLAPAVDNSPEAAPVMDEGCRENSGNLEAGLQVFFCRGPAGWRHVCRCTWPSPFRDDASQDVAILITEVDDRVLTRPSSSAFPDLNVEVVKARGRTNLIRP